MAQDQDPALLEIDGAMAEIEFAMDESNASRRDTMLYLAINHLRSARLMIENGLGPEDLAEPPSETARLAESYDGERYPREREGEQ